MHVQSLLQVIIVTSCIQVKTILHGGRIYTPRERLDMREMDFDLTAGAVPITWRVEREDNREPANSDSAAALGWARSQSIGVKHSRRQQRTPPGGTLGAF